MAVNTNIIEPLPAPEPVPVLVPGGAVPLDAPAAPIVTVSVTLPDLKAAMAAETSTVLTRSCSESTHTNKASGRGSSQW